MKLEKRLTDEEQNRLLRAYKDTRDPEIRARLIMHNQTLASWHARKMSTYHLHADDLEQAAMIGVIRAIDGFEPDKGFKFSTYATVWMRHEIQEFYRMNSVVPLSKEDSQMVNAEMKVADPSDRALQLNVIRNTYSLDVPAEFGGNIVQAEAAVTDDYGEEQASYVSTVKELIGRLSPENQVIVEATLRGKNFGRIAKDIGRSREYVRQRYLGAVVQLQGDADMYAVANPFKGDGGE